MQYCTLKSGAQAELKEKGSKFLAFVFPVVDESDIKTKLLDLKTQYPDATHHCYAWLLGANRERERANDDGEPNNSAGRPILRQLYGANLTNVLAVVVRYYGGTKLGVPGLIQAYGGATKMALELSETVELDLRKTYTIEYEFQDEGLAFRLVRQLQTEPDRLERGNAGILYFRIPADKESELENWKETYYQLKIELWEE
ncbi:MAG: YigZ family protein [Bacteroidetes bacterium]|nr:MAG: YigZ family protein [Bacteroidota bacterium]